MKEIIILMVLMFLVPLATAVETPPFTVELRGVAMISGMPVADGTEISAWAGELMVGQAVVDYGIGYYNHLEIKWDDPMTAIDEGVTFDEISLEKIRFKIGDQFVTEPGYFTIVSSQGGQTLDLDLDIREEKPLEFEGETFGMFLVFIGLILIIAVVIILIRKYVK